MQNYYSQMEKDWRASAGRSPNPYGSPEGLNVPGYYTLQSPFSSYMQLTPNAGVEKNPDWAFYVSAAHDQVADAWNIVVDTLIKDGDSHVAKVVAPPKMVEFCGRIPDYDNRTIVIYAADDNADYEKIMEQIEEKLHARNITPGKDLIVNRPIPGSRYVSYRCQLTDGKYPDWISLSDAKKHPDRNQQYNPYSKQDPYTNTNFLHLYNKRHGIVHEAYTDIDIQPG